MVSQSGGRGKPDGKPKDIVVFSITKDATCDECGEELWSGDLLRVVEGTAHCMACADLGHLVYLPSGDAALTRRASKHSALRAVVVRWSRSRKRYERQGILVEEAALAQAEEECLSDAGLRAARRAREAEGREKRDEAFVRAFAQAIRSRYPTAPAGAEVPIAEHACQKYSGRVGRSAAAKALEPAAIDPAVGAAVRHRWTRYDELLMAGWDRNEARAEVWADVATVLDSWRGGGG
ncbi:MAG: hypothetical protein JWL57_1204 [Actinobacteria bacterium]|nr:hypothetical protein [Actinomycetota bacterium]